MNLEDIAKKAGVSKSTVSRVINNEPYVSDRTRVRVMEVIERENFSPNPNARALVRQRTEVIAVAVPQIVNVFFGDNSYYPQLLQGMSAAIAQRDHAMLLFLQNNDEDRRHYAQRIAQHRLADGVIPSSMTVDDVVVQRLVEADTLFVMVERPPDHLLDRISYVTIDNVGSAQAAVEHLISTGRRRIATITGNLNIADGEDRFIGYRLALEKAGMPVDEDLIYNGYFSYHFGYVGAKELLAKRPDAIFAAGDTAALAAVKAIQEAGLRVPDDIAIVGFDDLDIARSSDPPLTTIRHPIELKGATAANLLIDLIEGKQSEPRGVILPTELVIRESSGATSEIILAVPEGGVPS